MISSDFCSFDATTDGDCDVGRDDDDDDDDDDGDDGDVGCTVLVLLL